MLPGTDLSNLEDCILGSQSNTIQVGLCMHAEILSRILYLLYSAFVGKLYVIDVVCASFIFSGHLSCSMILTIS